MAEGKARYKYGYFYDVVIKLFFAHITPTYIAYDKSNDTLWTGSQTISCYAS